MQGTASDRPKSTAAGRPAPVSGARRDRHARDTVRRRHGVQPAAERDAEQRDADRDTEADREPGRRVAGAAAPTAATSAPVMPVPSAVPSESVSEIAADARPCSADGTSAAR